MDRAAALGREPPRLAGARAAPAAATHALRPAGRCFRSLSGLGPRGRWLAGMPAACAGLRGGNRGRRGACAPERIGNLSRSPGWHGAMGRGGPVIWAGPLGRVGRGENGGGDQFDLGDRFAISAEFGEPKAEFGAEVAETGFVHALDSGIRGVGGATAGGVDLDGADAADGVERSALLFGAGVVGVPLIFEDIEAALFGRGGPLGDAALAARCSAGGCATLLAAAPRSARGGPGFAIAPRSTASCPPPALYASVVTTPRRQPAAGASAPGMNGAQVGREGT